jgi:hypothetical protein
MFYLVREARNGRTLPRFFESIEEAKLAAVKDNVEFIINAEYPIRWEEKENPLHTSGVWFPKKFLFGRGSHEYVIAEVEVEK